MIAKIAGTALLAAATVMPVQPAAAQNPVGGMIGGGIAGGIIGGAAGGGRGAAIGAVIGASTGAIIAAEAQRNRRGYYAWHDGCYVQRRDGAWIRVHPRYCY
jgi:outer membrane lipoprotein SlyB